MKTFAIGDIHGCRVALETLLEAIAPSPDDLTVCLGDYVDRGPDSKGVVDTLLEFRKTHKLVHLKGNHEIQMEAARKTTRAHEFFIRDVVGGADTLSSYGCSIHEISDEHWDFLMNESQPCYETDSHIFVHGGVQPHLPISEQTISTFCWERFHTATPHMSGKTVVCGHTIQGDTPTNYRGLNICIDTCAYGGGWLTGLDIDSGTYIQSNEKGEIRHGNI